MALSIGDLAALHGGGSNPAAARDLDAMDAAGEGATAERRSYTTGHGAVRGGATFKPNVYAGTCVNCGGSVAAQAGLRDRRDGRWVVFHRGDCPPPPAAAPVAAEGDADGDAEGDGDYATLVTAAAAYPTPAVWPGDYTIETPDGHRTFKVSVQTADADFAPGSVIISYLSGPQNTSDFTGFGFVKGTPARPTVVYWKRHRGNVALKRDTDFFLANLGTDLVLAARRCIRPECGRKLTNPNSIKAGIGPTCANL